jgi:hypothetical protein
MLCYVSYACRMSDRAYDHVLLSISIVNRISSRFVYDAALSEPLPEAKPFCTTLKIGTSDGQPEILQAFSPSTCQPIDSHNFESEPCFPDVLS